MGLILFKILFWVSAGIFLFVYIGYPLAITLVARLKKGTVNVDERVYEPEVSIIIAARNEEKTIEKKLINTLELDYPKEKLEIIVVSDHSTDGTVGIVEKFKGRGVRLIALADHLGKTGSQNLAVESASGEILVFSDANAMYVPGSIRYLANHFQDHDVGCVSGELCYSNPEESIVGREENLYWRYEKYIKKQENRIGAILGANGSIYAVRKSDYVVLEKDIISDFIEPLAIAARGKCVVYESRAISFENVSLSFHEEFIRKRRIVSRSLYSLIVHSYLLNPIKNVTLTFELFSHKILRWISPVFLFTLLIGCAGLISNRFYAFIFLFQVLFCIIGFLGYIMRNRKNLPTFIFIPYYCCLLGLASILGIVDYIKGKKVRTWDPVR